MRGRAEVIGGLLAAAILIAATPASAQSPTIPYDGLGPFNCDLQDAGTTTDFPQPDAEPFCVEFDKTQQNVSDFGIFDFFSKEPARVAAASPKCFYFQRDHWTGSFVQGADPEFWHWDGSYFFDKSNGSGGANLANFRIGGEPADAGPYAPTEFQPYLSPGGGGGSYVSGEVQTDPSCAALVDTPTERAQVYYHTMPGGKVFRKRIGPFALGEERGALHEANGPPHEMVGATERFNVTGAGQLRLAYRGNIATASAAGSAGGSASVAAILTTSANHRRGKVHPGLRGRKARRKLRATFAFRVRAFRVFEAPRRKRSRLFLGIRKGTLEWLAITDPRQIRSGRGLKRTLRRLSRDGKGRVDSTGMPW